jgi:hypothetical protein
LISIERDDPPTTPQVILRPRPSAEFGRPGRSEPLHTDHKASAAAVPALSGAAPALPTESEYYTWGRNLHCQEHVVGSSYDNLVQIDSEMQLQEHPVVRANTDSYSTISFWRSTSFALRISIDIHSFYLI